MFGKVERNDKKCNNTRSVNLRVLEMIIWNSTVDVWSNSYTIKEKVQRRFSDDLK